MLAIRQNSVGWPASLQVFRRDIDDVFRRFWPENQQEAISFPVDIHEDDEAFHVEAELPGFTKEQVHVELEEGVLSISAEQKQEEEEETKGRYHIHERCYTQVARRFNMPSGIDPNKVEAKMENGVLHLKLMKAEQAQARQITIE